MLGGLAKRRLESGARAGGCQTGSESNLVGREMIWWVANLAVFRIVVPCPRPASRRERRPRREARPCVPIYIFETRYAWSALGAMADDWVSDG